MGVGGNNSGRIHEFAERGAVSEEQESDLGVMHIAYCLQDMLSLLHPGAGVLLAVFNGAHGSTEQLEVALAHPLYVGREGSGIGGRVEPSCGYHFALIGTKLQTYAPSGSGEA